MTTLITGTYISTANVNLGGTFVSENFARFAGNTYVEDTFVSNNYFENEKVTLVSNNYFEEEKVTLGSFVDMSDYNLSSLGGSLIHASANSGIGGNTYSIPSTASAVYIWAQGAGGNGGTAKSEDGLAACFGGNGGGGSCAVTKITITHQPHSTLTDLYCEFNPQGDAVVYIGTSNSGVEIARGYKGIRGVDHETTERRVGHGGWLQKNVSGKSISSSSTSAYTETTITDIVNPGTSRAHFPKFLGPYLEHGEGVELSSRFSANNQGYVSDGRNGTGQGYSGGGLFSRGILGETNSFDDIFTAPSDSLDGIDAHTLKWSFGSGGTGGISIDENLGSSDSPRPAGEGGYACAVIIVR